MPGGNLGEINVKVQSEGADEVADDLESIESEGIMGEGPDGGQGDGDGAMGGIMDAVMGMSQGMMAAVAGIGAIVGVLLSMEPIQKLMSAFMKVVQAFFTPLAMMLIKLLSPVLRAMVKLLPLWMKFWQDPIGAIEEGLETLWGWIKQLPRMIWQFLKMVPGLIWDLFIGYLKVWGKIGQILWNALVDLGHWLWNRIQAGINFITKLPGAIWGLVKKLAGDIWNKFKAGIDWLTNLPSAIWDAMTGMVNAVWKGVKKLPGAIANALADLIPGTEREEGTVTTPVGDIPGQPAWHQSGGFIHKTGLHGIHAGEAVLSNDHIDQLVNAMRSAMNRPQANISIEGGLDTFIENVSRNRNVRR